ncbi:iron complex transport system ATP-binding protein [Clostridium cavendishii DSM 21758]|uniref:Iron complex transport system ATP-binding protein n=1 Tax=Clostridium cavendishii DSM 21758 TaxID=1121302 RepID=A0A1M6T824_9CLOT|nr:ABC transporter ATP-binding protein [Clostridium cavendishii]SHK53137.1 iron complex transport system ATP-binding protein [Clostridium cavendishii DSM 21758]
MGFIDIRNLNYGHKHNKILQNININFNKGKFYAIVGPNGSGKSTLLKNIIKALEPTLGEILLEGKNISALDAKYMASKISYVPQNTYIELEFTCLDVVMMGNSHRLRVFQNESKEQIASAYEAMKKLEVYNLKDKLVTEISGGERQRVILARAIAQDASCIILDEPISHLDIKYQIIVLKELQELKKNGKTIISVLHDLNFTLDYADNVILMKNGCIYDFGEAIDVITSGNLKAVYDVDGEIIKLNNKSQIVF